MPAPTNTSYQALYRACMKEAASRGRTLMQKIVARAVRSMPQRAAAAPEQTERNLLTEAARILMKHEAELCEAYPQALLAEFAQAIAGANTRPAGLSFDSLELMGDDQMRESVEVVRAQQAVAHAVEAELPELNSLICAVQGLKTVQPDRNPLRPEVYVRSLRTVLMESPVSHEVRTRWLHHLGEALGPELAIVYQEVSLTLRAQGVVAAGYVVLQQAESPQVLQRAPAEAAAAAVPAALQAASLLNLTELRRLLSGQLDTPAGTAAGDFAAKFAREFEQGDRSAPSTEFSMTVPAAFEALQEMKQVDQVVKRLKQRRSVSVPREMTGSTALREQLRLEATSSGQALGLEVVNLMVENIAHDARLLPPVQKAVRELEPALLRLALRDPRFFSDKSHPARQLLDQMTQRSLAWESVDAPGFAHFIGALQEAVEALLDTHIDGAEPFAFALASLEEAWDSAKKRDRRQREKAVRALLQAEQRNLLARKVSRQMRVRPDVQVASPAVAAFVAGPWSQVVAQARLLDQSGAPDPAGYTGLVSDLLWSAQPRLASANPARLARMIPPMLEKLRHGLASIDYPSAQTERFFDHLISLHQKSLSQQLGASAADPPPMTREELDAQFADSGVDEGAWIGPAEARESGFMETHHSGLVQPLFQPTGPGTQEGVTEPAELMPAALPEEQLQAGTWVELMTDARWQRFQLTWASPHGTLYMFTGAGGATHSMTRRLLDKLFAAGSLRLLAEQPVVEGALDAVAQAALRNSVDFRT